MADSGCVKHHNETTKLAKTSMGRITPMYHILQFGELHNKLMVFSSPPPHSPPHTHTHEIFMNAQNTSWEKLNLDSQCRVVQVHVKYATTCIGKSTKVQGLVVQQLDNAIHWTNLWINLYLVELVYLIHQSAGYCVFHWIALSSVWITGTRLEFL